MKVSNVRRVCQARAGLWCLWSFLMREVASCNLGGLGGTSRMHGELLNECVVRSGGCMRFELTARLVPSFEQSGGGANAESAPSAAVSSEQLPRSHPVMWRRLPFSHRRARQHNPLPSTPPFCAPATKSQGRYIHVCATEGQSGPGSGAEEEQVRREKRTKSDTSVRGVNQQKAAGAPRFFFTRRRRRRR